MRFCVYILPVFQLFLYTDSSFPTNSSKLSHKIYEIKDVAGKKKFHDKLVPNPCQHHLQTTMWDRMTGADHCASVSLPAFHSVSCITPMTYFNKWASQLDTYSHYSVHNKQFSLIFYQLRQLLDLSSFVELCNSGNSKYLISRWFPYSVGVSP